MPALPSKSTATLSCPIESDILRRNVCVWYACAVTYVPLSSSHFFPLLPIFVVPHLCCRWCWWCCGSGCRWIRLLLLMKQRLLYRRRPLLHRFNSATNQETSDPHPN